MQQADTENYEGDTDDEADLPDAVVRYGVKGALAARLLPSLIKVAKSENQQKLRKLLCHELTDVIFQWRESTYDRLRDGPFTTELHWQLYETLAKNRKLPALLIKLAANTQGKRKRYDFLDFHPSQYIPGWGKCGRGQGQSKPVTNAHTVLIELSKAARRWCYQEDDVEKFAFMATEPLFKGEMLMSVSEMFFDMPRYGTGQVAQWWWDKHQPKEAPDLAPFPALTKDPFGGHFADKSWCVLKMTTGSRDRSGYDHGRHGLVPLLWSQDWCGYDHASHGMLMERLDAETMFSNPIFFQPSYWDAESGGPPIILSLYELGVSQITYGLHAPPFTCCGDDVGRFSSVGAKWHPEPNKCGRKCLQWLLPSFGFWFALGLSKRMLVREDRMVYSWWLVKRLFKRALFKLHLAKMTNCTAFNAVHWAPGGIGYVTGPMKSETAAAMAAPDGGSGLE